MMQRLFTIFSIVSLLIGSLVFIIPSTEASTSYDDQYEYDITGDNSVTITKYLGTGGVLTIPSTILGRDITKIGAFAFAYTPVVVVTIPDTVTEIRSGAFYGCNALQEVILPDSMEKIETQAFYLCTELKTINLPEGLYEIGDLAFAYCTSLGGLYLITTPHSLDSIPVGMFYGCSALYNLIIHNGPTFIGDYAFAECYSLTTVITPNTAVYIGESAFFNCIGLVNAIISNGTTTIHAHAFEKCSSLIRVRMSQTVTTIGSNAFAYCTQLDEITFNRGVTSIGTFALAYTSIDFIYFQGMSEPSIGASWLEGVAGTPSAIYFAWSSIDGIAGCNSMDTLTNWTYGNIDNEYMLRYFGASNIFNIPLYVTGSTYCRYIGAYCFYGNTDLTQVSSTAMTGYNSLGSYAFAYCTGIQTFNVGAGISVMGSFVFYNCINLITFTWEAGTYYITTLPESSFQYCWNMEHITLPNYITIINTAAFYACYSLQSVGLANITSLGYAAFAECHSLASVSIPGSLTTVGESAFYNCNSLASITFHTGTIKIGSWAFEYCTSLTALTTVASITEIDDYAFEFCTGLTSVSLVNGITRLGYSVFHGCSALPTIILPVSLVSLGDNWLSITAGVFDMCSALTSISVDSSNPIFSSAGGVIFNKNKTILIQYPGGKTGPYSVPITVNFIMPGAFWFCAVSKVTIPSGVTNITYACFASCPNLEEVIIPDTVTEIEPMAFQLSPKLNNMVIPDAVTVIGENAFYFCIGLDTVTIGKNVQIIGELAFYSCTKLKNIVVPDRVYLVDNYSFAYCTSLEYIRIGQGIAWIGNAAFFGDSNLRNVYFYSDSVPYLGAFWIRGTNEDIIGHAKSGSSFPLSGYILYGDELFIEEVNGGVDSMIMGAYIPIYIPDDLNIEGFGIYGIIWVIMFFLPVLILGTVFKTPGIMMGTAIMSIVFGITMSNGYFILMIGLLVSTVYLFSIRGE